jgi:hypothetical protein
MAHGFLPRILSRTGLVENIVKAGNHATRNFCDINSQIKGHAFLPPISLLSASSTPGPVEGDRTTRKFCDINSQINDHGFLSRAPP